MLNPSFEACNNAHSSMGAYFPKPSSILGNIKNKPAASTIAKSPTLLTWLVKKENGTSVFKTAFLWLLQMLDSKKKKQKKPGHLFVCVWDWPAYFCDCPFSTKYLLGEFSKCCLHSKDIKDIWYKYFPLVQYLPFHCFRMWLHRFFFFLINL